MSNLTQFKPTNSSITLTSTTTTKPTSESDTVQLIDPVLSGIFYLRSGSVSNVVYFKLLDGTYDGQTVTLLRDRHNGWHSYDSGSGDGDSGMQIHFRGVDYNGYPDVGYKWSWDSDIGWGGPNGANESVIAKWSKNHWMIFTGVMG